MFKLIQAADTRIFHSVFTNFSHSSLTKTARLVSFTGDGWFYPSMVPIILFTKPGESGAYLVLAIGGFTLERTLYFILKLSFRRRRPPQSLAGVEPAIQASDEFSLPSGHTCAAFFFVTFLTAGISLAFLPLYLWAAMVGLSRVILGVHFPTDILAGALIGTTLAQALV